MKHFTYEEFPRKLCAYLPGLGRVYEENLADYGEILPHALLGDCVRHMLDVAESPDRGGQAMVDTMLLLEEGMGSVNPLVQNLVAVSFVENLLGEERVGFSVIRSMFGPHLEAQYVLMAE